MTKCNQSSLPQEFRLFVLRDKSVLVSGGLIVLRAVLRWVARWVLLELTNLQSSAMQLLLYSEEGATAASKELGATRCWLGLVHELKYPFLYKDDAAATDLLSFSPALPTI